MPDYKDVGHRPHARHTGEFPEFSVQRGPMGLKVSLDVWGPKEDIFAVLYDQFQSNWGDAPSDLKDVIKTRRTENRLNPKYTSSVSRLDTQSGWAYLTDDEQAFVTKAFAGQTLSNPLEALTFMFTIDGVSRACTHQMVRTRIGASFMQHGGRDNDWRHRDWTLPETLWRALEEFDRNRLKDGLVSCVTNPSALNELRYAPIWSEMADGNRDRPYRELVDMYLHMGHQLYAALVDIGIPWQDARRVLHMGTQTYLHANYTYPALAGVLANRLEHIMDWEINCVAQLMLRELHMKCPKVMWQFLGSHSDKAHTAKFAGLDSWPPDGKWPAPALDVCECGHGASDHPPLSSEHTFDEYTPCNRCSCKRFVRKVDTSRAHRPEQMPFWILSDAAMLGGPIEWIPTNGVYPEELKP